MDSPERRTEFEVQLLNSINEIAKELIAWVVLPNHYHVLISIQSLDDVSMALKNLHGRTSREWNIEDNLTEKRRVWYKFVDRYMRNQAQLGIAFNYVHYNPIKHGYVSDPYDWPWSSLQMYDEDRGRDWLQEQWKSYQPSIDFGKDWDDVD